MKKLLLVLLLPLMANAQIYMDVDTAVTVPVNKAPLTNDGTTADIGVTWDELGLSLDDGPEQGEDRVVGVGSLRVVTSDDVLRERAEAIFVTPASEKLESPHSDVALRNAG